MTTTAAAAASLKLANSSPALAVLTTVAADENDVPLFFDSKADPFPGGGGRAQFDARGGGRGGVGAAVVADRSMALRSDPPPKRPAVLFLPPYYSS